jgi:hypothetical protein
MKSLHKPSGTDHKPALHTKGGKPSFFEVLRDKAAKGGKTARNLLRAIERQTAVASDLFRSASYLSVASDSVAVDVLRDGRKSNHPTLQIDLREWLSPEILEEYVPWAEPTIRLSVAVKPKRNASVFTVRAQSKEAAISRGAVCVEIKTATQHLCTVRLTADHTSQIASCPSADVKLEEVAYRVSVDQE